MDEKEVVKDPETTAGKEADNPAGAEKKVEVQKVPDERFSEKVAENEELKKQNASLIQAIQQGQQPAPKEEEEPDNEFADPEVKKLKKQMATDRKQFGLIIGKVLDDQDKNNVNLSPQTKYYAKHSAAVDSRRIQEAQRGRQFTREEVCHLMRDNTPPVDATPKGETPETPETAVPETKTTKKKTKLASEKTLAEKEQDLSGKEF